MFIDAELAESLCSSDVLLNRQNAADFRIKTTWITNEMVSKGVKKESDEQRQIGAIRTILDQRITFANSVGEIVADPCQVNLIFKYSGVAKFFIQD